MKNMNVIGVAIFLGLLVGCVVYVFSPIVLAVWYDLHGGQTITQTHYIMGIEDGWVAYPGGYIGFYNLNDFKILPSHTYKITWINLLGNNYIQNVTEVG